MIKSCGSHEMFDEKWIKVCGSKETCEKMKFDHHFSKQKLYQTSTKGFMDFSMLPSSLWAYALVMDQWIYVIQKKNKKNGPTNIWLKIQVFYRNNNRTFFPGNNNNRTCMRNKMQKAKYDRSRQQLWDGTTHVTVLLSTRKEPRLSKRSSKVADGP